MEIKINQSSSQSGRWGTLYVCAVDLASNRLSGDSFKWWVKLALNKDGYNWKDQVPTEIIQELSNQGYMSVRGEDAEFFTMPRAGATNQPVKIEPPPKYEPPIPKYEPPEPIQENEMYVCVGSPDREPDIDDDFERQIVAEYIRRGYLESFDLAVAIGLTPDQETQRKISAIWRDNQDFIMAQWDDYMRQKYQAEIAREDDLPW